MFVEIFPVGSTKKYATVAFMPFKVIHARSLILVQIESAYASTFY